ncbi:WD repeat-containing protein 64 isoform X2 [Hemicordylus capensis]|nr:WD repeat-containing protein 64 isoform X2 [Hemicordylus capensis]XP_053157128.1 WD repeat-containing protein 64 isoform X2 [Hemicordylus capensis]XP_053157132.1 WD repeat-containing protein 64 isoform X2 [Hemicordylus capensis]XP_053157141.1 WD repeat-containing protein 64 isoform X2 [Hemicordylus capensis]XP_053157149.1 WD repeat-containing protein 64 isoform X2 [Hemicordylus capensis]XP_053157161.1 WD repeat-containing protein 64 isoform X2 [Hemicordylus capensis]XP_053157172.1 WD repea
MDYDTFYAAVQKLFGPDVKTQDVKTFYRKISNNPDGRTEWCEIFGYYILEGDALAAQLDEENMVFLVSRKQRITKAGVKRRDVIKCIVKVPQLDFIVTASQKGTLTVFSSQMRILTTTSIQDSSWITGCDYLNQLKRVVAVTERTIIVWDYKSQGSPMDNCFIIKPMEHCVLCVCAIHRPSELLMKDDILMGDDGGYVNMLTMTSDDFGLKQSKSKKKTQLMVLDSKKFQKLKRKLHDDWVVKVKYISALNCFGSCSLDSVHSLVLDDLKRLEDNIPIRDFSVPRGVNAFTYCGKANIIVTGGDDKILRLWHPNINTKPVGKLMGHLFSITEIVTNEKDQHIISLSAAKIFRVWDIQTLSLLQVFHDSLGGPREAQIFAMIFDHNHGTLVTGSSVIDIYPLTRMIQDTKQVPQTHERNINVLVYNKAFHQVLTICSESIVKVWELESGQAIYQIEDAHGPNVELTCAAIDKNGFHLATGACDGTVRTWDFGSGQVLKVLPLSKESKDNEHWLMQMVYLKASGSRHVILALEYSGMIKIVQSNEGDVYLSITWDLPEAVSLALQGNLLMSLKLTPNARKANGFFPDVQLLPENVPVQSDTENLPPLAEVKCFDVLKIEGYNLLATASANGSIIMWDFESATARHIFRTGHGIQGDGAELLGINMLLFLHRSAFYLRQLSQASTYSSEAQSDLSPTQEVEASSSISVRKEGAKNEPPAAATPSGQETKLADSPTLGSRGISFHLPGAGYEQAEFHRHIPILASAHEDGCICLWTITGDLLKEILPFTKHPPIPLTALCTDVSAKMLFAANKEGHVIRWNIGSFLEDPLDTNKHVKQQVCWRAHSSKIVNLFYDDERNIVVTASVDSSVRLWHSSNGHYCGYFGQRRPFELSDSTDAILPCDVNELPFTIKDDSKYMEKKQKFEYPLVLDKERWKTLTRCSLTLKKPGPMEIEQDFKFFRALSSPKIHKYPLESFKSANKDAGIVFGSIPIYRIISPTRQKTTLEDGDSIDSIIKRSRSVYNTPSRLTDRRDAKSSQTSVPVPSSIPSASRPRMKIKRL